MKPKNSASSVTTAKILVAHSVYEWIQGAVDKSQKVKEVV